MGINATLNFGENILADSNVCRAMYVENPGLKEKAQDEVAL